jgi:hypothetical protein
MEDKSVLTPWRFYKANFTSFQILKNNLLLTHEPHVIS